jgi:hypothetical protein
METPTSILAKDLGSRPLRFKIKNFTGLLARNLGSWIPGSRIFLEESLEIVDLGTTDPGFLDRLPGHLGSSIHWSKVSGSPGILGPLISTCQTYERLDASLVRLGKTHR